MPQQKTTGYRPAPASPTATVPQVRESAIEDLDDFLDEIDDLLSQEEEFALSFRQRGGQ